METTSQLKLSMIALKGWHFSKICGYMFPGVHTVRVPEDERHLLGADGNGPDGPAAADEPAGDHRLHQSLPA